MSGEIVIGVRPGKSAIVFNGPADISLQEFELGFSGEPDLLLALRAIHGLLGAIIEAQAKSKRPITATDCTYHGAPSGETKQ